MRPISSLKHETSLHVSVQQFVSVEDSMRRISAARLRHEMAKPERQSLGDNLKVRAHFCARLKLVSFSAKVDLSPRKGDEISPYFSQHSLCTPSIIVTVLSECTVVITRFHTFQLQFCCTMTDKAAAAVLAQERVHVS